MITAVGSTFTHLSPYQWDNINNRLNQLLDYAASHPDDKLTYHKSCMHIWVHTDTSYIAEPKAISCAGGYHYFRNKPKLIIQSDDPTPKRNYPVLVLCKFIDDVMSQHKNRKQVVVALMPKRHYQYSKRK